MTATLRRTLRWHGPLMWLTVAMGVTAVVSVVGYVVDDRVLVGVPIWAKPLKFSISFAAYAATLAWLISRLQRPGARRLARQTGTLIAVATGLEMAAIVLQVVRGTQSHFNFSTPFNSAVFAAMGLFVAVIFVATVAVAIALLRDSPALDRATAWAVRLGLLISIAGMSVGFLMVLPRPGQDDGAAVRGGHSIGTTDGGPSLPLLGWDTTGGDLRVPHFLGLHALQAIPLLALLLSVLPVTGRLGEQARVRLIAVGGAFVVGLFALTLWQAYRGQPVTAPDRWTLAAATVLVLVTIGAAFIVLRSATPPPARVRARSAATVRTR